MGRIAGFLCLFALAGCPGPMVAEDVWVKNGATNDDFFKDAGQCRAQAYSVPVAGPQQIAMVYGSCLNGKGWRLEQRLRPR